MLHELFSFMFLPQEKKKIQRLSTQTLSLHPVSHF